MYTALYEYEQGQEQMALLNPVFTSAAQIRAVFNTAVAIQVINVASEADLGTALTSKAVLLGLNLTAYNTLADKALVHTMLEPAFFTTAAEIQAALDEAVAIQQINLAGEAELGTALSDNRLSAAARPSPGVCGTGSASFHDSGGDPGGTGHGLYPAGIKTPPLLFRLVSEPAQWHCPQHGEWAFLNTC